MAALPTGTVTFLFTDIEGSTRIWEREPDRMRVLLAQHDAIVRRTVEKHGGHVFKTIGDAFCVAFHDPLEAADAAIETQQELLGAFTDFRVRAAIYTGPAVETDGDYFGPAVNRVARLLSAGHGGQILVDGASAEMIGEAHREDSRLRLLGEHRLRDLQAQEKVFQVVHPKLPEAFPPLNTLDIAFRRGVVRAVAMSGVVILALTGLALVAVSQARRADKNADLAFQRERRAIRGEKNATLNAIAAHRESIRANREERAAKAAAEQRRIALGVAVQARNKATVAAEKERLAKLGETAQKQIALYQKAQAGTQRDLALTQLLRFHIANGDRFVESGGPVSGLPWYARVLEITRQAKRPETGARIRLASVLRHCPKLLQVLQHDGFFYAAAFSPDGRYLAVLTDLVRLYVWDTQSGRLVGPSQTLPAQCTGIEFSPDGKQILTGMVSSYLPINAARLQVWSPLGGEPVTLELPSPSSAVFSPDSRLVLAGSTDSFAAVLDARTGKQVGPRLPHPQAVRAVAFLRSSNKAVTGCDDTLLRVWDLPSGRLVKTLAAPSGSISVLRVTENQILAGTIASSLSVWDGEGRGEGAPPDRQIPGNVTYLDVSRDGTRVATCDYTARSVRVWDLGTGQPLTPPLLHPGGVSTAAFTAAGDSLTTACEDGCVRFWKSEGGLPAAPTLKLSTPCLSALYNARGDQLLTTSTDGIGRLWSGALPRPYDVAVTRAGVLEGAVFTSDGKRIVIVGDGKPSTVVADAETGKRTGTLATGPAPWTAIKVFPNAGMLLTTGPRRSMCFWDALSLAPITPILEQPEPVLAGGSEQTTVLSTVAISRDRKRVYAGFAIETGLDPADPTGQTILEHFDVTAFDLAAKKGIPFPFPVLKPLRIVTFTPDGEAVLLGGDDGMARLFQLPSGVPLSPSFYTGKATPSITISPDSQFAALRHPDSRVELWDLRSGKRVATLRHREPVLTVVFSPDSRRVLTGSMDGTARIWSVTTGRPTAPPLAHPGWWVNRAAFSPDGSQVATAGGVISDRGEARVWDSRTGEALTPILEQPKTIRGIAFSPDGKRVVTAGADGSARIWNLAPDNRSSRALSELAALLSGIHFAPDGSPERLEGRDLSHLAGRR